MFIQVYIYFAVKCKDFVPTVAGSDTNNTKAVKCVACPCLLNRKELSAFY